MMFSNATVNLNLHYVDKLLNPIIRFIYIYRILTFTSLVNIVNASFSYQFLKIMKKFILAYTSF